MLGTTTFNRAQAETESWMGQTMNQLSPSERLTVMQYMDPKKPLAQQDEDFYITFRNVSEASDLRRQKLAEEKINVPKEVAQIRADAIMEAAQARADERMEEFDKKAAASGNELSKMDRTAFREEITAAAHAEGSYKDRTTRMQAVIDKYQAKLGKPSGATDNTPKPLPAKDSDRVVGAVYEVLNKKTGKRVNARWNGNGFEVLE
jgi:hypothetical protein